MVEKRLARHNVVAVFDDLDDATAALDALVDAGLTADELSLLGPEYEMRPGEGTVHTHGAPLESGIATSAVAGIGGGAAAGGMLGALAGVAVAVIPGVGLAVGAGALYAAVAGASAGSVAGGLLGAEAGGRRAMMWDQTLSPMVRRVEEGRVLVGVHTEDPARADAAEQRVMQLEPREVRRLEADESFIAPGTAAAVAGRSVPSGDPTQPGGELGRDRVGEDAKLVGIEERGGPQDRPEEADPQP